MGVEPVLTNKILTVSIEKPLSLIALAKITALGIESPVVDDSTGETALGIEIDLGLSALSHGTDPTTLRVCEEVHGDSITEFL